MILCIVRVHKKFEEPNPIVKEEECGKTSLYIFFTSNYFFFETNIKNKLFKNKKIYNFLIKQPNP